MENSVIAVQIANGTFVPVLNTSSRKRRRLVVTTVRDMQTNVKIELYRGSDETMADAEYVGSLVIENIEPEVSGSPDISVLLGVDDSGNLNATAKDNKSGEYQSLSVSLEQLEAGGDYDMPDFQLSDEELTLDDLSLDDEDETGLDLADLTMDEGDADASSEPESDTELELDDLSFDDLDAEEAAEPETAESEPISAADESNELDDLSLDDISFDDEVGGEDLSLGEEAASADELNLDEDLGGGELNLDEDLSAADLAPDEELGDELEDELEDVSLEEISFDEEPAAASSTEETQPAAGEEGDEEESDILAGFSDEAFSFDESLSQAEGEEPPDDFGDFVNEDFGVESLETDSLEAEPAAADGGLDEGMVEADLGDEDFTFDEGADDEPLFPEPAGVGDEERGEDLGDDLDDTLSPEEFDRLDSQPVGSSDFEPEEAADAAVVPRRSNAIIYVGYLVLALAAIGVLTYLVFRLMEGPPAPPLRTSMVRMLGAAFLVPGFPRRRRRRRG